MYLSPMHAKATAGNNSAGPIYNVEVGCLGSLAIATACLDMCIFAVKAHMLHCVGKCQVLSRKHV